MSCLHFRRTLCKVGVQAIATCSLLVLALASESQVPGLDVTVEACCDSLPVFGKFLNPETVIGVQAVQLSDPGKTNPYCSLIEMFPAPIMKKICETKEEKGLSLQAMLKVNNVMTSNTLLKAGASLLGVFVEHGTCKDIGSKPYPADAVGPWSKMSRSVWQHGFAEPHSGFWETYGPPKSSVHLDPSLVVDWKCGPGDSGFAVSATWKDMTQKRVQHQTDYGARVERVSFGEGGHGAPAWECYDIIPRAIRDEWTSENKMTVEEVEMMMHHRALVYFYGEQLCAKKGNSLSLAGQLGIAFLVVSMLAGVLFFAWSRMRKQPQHLTGGLASARSPLQA